jgi:hypothetical protein
MEHGVHAQTREQMSAGAERLAQGLEQTVVAEPAVGDHQHRNAGENRREGRDQAHGLGELGLEGDHLAAHPHGAQRQGRLAKIKGEGQRQAAPAPVNDLQQSDRDDRLSPGIAALRQRPREQPYPSPDHGAGRRGIGRIM